MSPRTRSQAGLGWRARRPLTWQDLMMNPLGVGLNYLTIPSIKDVEKEELKEGGLVQPKKNTQKYHNQYWSIPKRASTETGDRSVSQALARSNQIKAYSEDTGRSVEDVRAIVGKGLETTFNTDDKVTSKGVATNNANASKAKLLDIPVEPGRTKWVGTNSTWTDRYGNTIAPREGTNTTTTVKNTPTELLKQETKNSGLDPNKLISEGGSKKGPGMTLEDGSINPEWQKAYPQSTEAKVDLIDQGLKTNEQGNLVPWFKGEKLGTRAEFSGDKNTPLQKWQAKELAKIPDEKASSSGPSAGAVMGTIGKVMQMLDKPEEPALKPTEINTGSKSSKVANTFKSAIKDPDGWGWYGRLQSTWDA